MQKRPPHPTKMSLQSKRCTMWAGDLCHSVCNRVDMGRRVRSEGVGGDQNLG